MKTLYFTTTEPHSMFSQASGPLVTMEGELTGEPKLRTAYIHGEAQDIAGFDIPVFLSGNLEMLDQPIEKQNIIMLLPGRSYRCQAVRNSDGIVNKNRYYLILKNDQKQFTRVGTAMMKNGHQRVYDVYDTGTKYRITYINTKTVMTHIDYDEFQKTFIWHQKPLGSDASRH